MGLYLERPDSIEHANGLKKLQEDTQIIQRYRDAERNNTVIGIPAEVDDNAGADALKTREDKNMLGGHCMNSHDKIFKAIRHLLDDGQKEAAFWTMGKLLQEVPESAPLHIAAANLAYELGEIQNALTHFRLAVRQDPHNAQYLKNLADFYYVAQKDPENALLHYEKVLQFDPDHFESLVMAGHVCVSLHRYADAQGYYERAHSLAPDNAEIQQLLAKMSLPSQDHNPPAMSADHLYTAAQKKARRR